MAHKGGQYTQQYKYYATTSIEHNEIVQNAQP